MPVRGNGTAETGLGGEAGYGETAVARGDDSSAQLDLTAVFGTGLNLFGTRVAATDVYVNTNGTLSFGAAFDAYPTQANADPGLPMIAPFWGDVDTRLDGEGNESGAIWVDLDTGADVVSITWDLVGVYRRNADVANRVQLQLFDRGQGDLDIVFRYERIDWTIGTAEGDAGARAGLVGAAQPTWITFGSGHEGLQDLPVTIGNSGVAGLWVYQLRGGTMTQGNGGGTTLTGTPQADTLTGADLADRIDGQGGADVLRGEAGADTIDGGEGADTLNGGPGDDLLRGGPEPADLRDLIFAGAGNDSVEGGAGNDEVYGEDGNDTLVGGTGSDSLYGQPGDDLISGGSLSDLIFGGDGADFINGGFGFDRVNGGTGADRFYHLGVAGHGSDWIQDYRAEDFDVLAYGGSAIGIGDFQINKASTPNAGSAQIPEVFVIHRPSGQILWALVDGAAQHHVGIQIGNDVFDLLI